MASYKEISIKVDNLCDWNANNTKLTYSPSTFRKEWAASPTIDWATNLSTLWDRTVKAKETLEPSLKENFQRQNGSYENDFMQERDSSSPEFPKIKDGIQLDYEIKEVFLIRNRKEESDYTYNQFAHKFYPELEKLQIQIGKCIDFQEENKDKPPYFFNPSSNDKIPFWGKQSEFVALWYLLIETGFFAGSLQTNSLKPPKKDNPNSLEFENFQVLKKEKISQLLSKYFFSVNVSDNKPKEALTVKRTDFKQSSINSALNEAGITQLSHISLDQLEEKIEAVLTRLKNLKKSFKKGEANQVKS